jgi:protein-L-isoaspartate O-methyltransferase
MHLEARVDSVGSVHGFWPRVRQYYVSAVLSAAANAGVGDHGESADSTSDGYRLVYARDEGVWHNVGLQAPDGKRLRYGWNGSRWAREDVPPNVAALRASPKYGDFAHTLGAGVGEVDRSRTTTRAPTYADRLAAKTADSRERRKQEQAERGSKLRALADAMQKDIDYKSSGGGSANQNWTPRRARMSEGMREEGDQLAIIQRMLYQLAEDYDDGIASPYAGWFSTKAGCKLFLQRYLWWLREEERNAQYGYTPKPPSTWPEWLARRKREDERYPDKDIPGIAAAFVDVFERSKLLGRKNADKQTASRMAAKLREVDQRYVGQIDGFVPTPVALAARVVRLAEINPGAYVLEPSAGSGRLVQAVLDAQPTATVIAVERHASLVEVLRERFAGDARVTVVHGDFMQQGYGEAFDAVVMNPPYENGLDGIHVRFAWDLVKPGGRLVALVGAGLFFRENQRDQAFRDWLSDVNGRHEELVDAFKESGVGVRAGLIWAEKE